MVKTYNIHEAKTHLSRLVDEAEKGESFIIAKAGKPKVKVMRIDLPQAKSKVRTLGLLEGMYEVPEDFDTMFSNEIEQMFHGKK